MSAPSRFRLYPRAELARPDRLIASVNCGHCHHPAIPHGSLLFFAPDLPIEPDSFVLLEDPAQPDFDGSAVKFLRRDAAGELELVSNVGRKPLTPAMRVLGTLVIAYLPGEDDAATDGVSELDARVRELVEVAMAREQSRRDQVSTDAASRWGRPPAASSDCGG